MDISQTLFSFSGLVNGGSQARYNEPEGASFQSVLDQCCSKAGGATQSASFSASVLNISYTSFGFDSQPNSFDPVREFIDALFDHITGHDSSRKTDAAVEEQGGGQFGFTSAFQSVFGASGPLIDFINSTTTNLGLSAEKNLALQNIAINNQDATRSRESIDKIAVELKAAGIAA